MDPAAADRRLKTQGGFATVQHVAAVALSLVFFALLANLIVMQYTMGAVTGALDEGVRYAARSGGDPDGCLERIDQAIHSILAGEVARTLRVDCWVDGSNIRAEATGLLSGWLPAVPDMAFRRTAVAPIEGVFG